MPTGDDLSTVGTSDPQYRAWAGKSAAYRLQQQKQYQAEKDARTTTSRGASSSGSTSGNAQGAVAPPSRSIEEERLKEQNAYFRRIEVCNKLMEIAMQTNDAAMQREIEQVETKAFEIYQKRSGQSASALSIDTKQDDAVLGSKLGPTKASDSGMMVPTEKKATRTEGKR